MACTQIRTLTGTHLSSKEGITAWKVPEMYREKPNVWLQVKSHHVPMLSSHPTQPRGSGRCQIWICIDLIDTAHSTPCWPETLPYQLSEDSLQVRWRVVGNQTFFPKLHTQTCSQALIFSSSEGKTTWKMPETYWEKLNCVASELGLRLSCIEASLHIACRVRHMSNLNLDL